MTISNEFIRRCQTRRKRDWEKNSPLEPLHALAIAAEELSRTPTNEQDSIEALHRARYALSWCVPLLQDKAVKRSLHFSRAYVKFSAYMGQAQIGFDLNYYANTKNVLKQAFDVINEALNDDPGQNENGEDIVATAQLKYADLGKEYERRWELNSLPDNPGKASKIKQGMISEVEGKAYIRIREQDGKYTMTAKYFPQQQEAETEISKEIFETLWPTVTKPQVKTRYAFKSKDDHDWVIDEMEDGSIIAECETKRKNGKIEVPEEFDVKREKKYD